MANKAAGSRMNEGTMPAIAHIMEQKQNKQNKQPPPTPEKKTKQQ